MFFSVPYVKFEKRENGVCTFSETIKVVKYCLKVEHLKSVFISSFTWLYDGYRYWKWNIFVPSRSVISFKWIDMYYALKDAMGNHIIL